ncbi:MAG: hypothetical protein PHH61_06315 [Candidatus Nanoarchaeia archaeon]|nr:hypothetical protein [Candidatus Nanoarchaeia archaeon]
MNEIKLGYEIGSGEPVNISLSHLIATGITQLSGKTTTEEALIKRSGKRAIVFKTKVGETGFGEGVIIPPYFKEKSDWQYVSSLLEATLKERLKFERSWIIEVCKGADSLLQVKANIDKKLSGEERLNSLSRSVYTTLQAYFEMILPQLQYANFSRTLELTDGINIMDLERFSEEIQSLVIRSVLDTVLNQFKDTIVVIPEAWKFLPQERGSPCKLAAESFIRQGATNGNYLWIDSQDMAGVDKTPLKQISTWILGLQRERNEVEHTLDEIALPNKQKPKPEEIMTLKKGHFIVATPEMTKRVYVQPAWLDDATALGIAKGEIEVSTIKRPEQLVSIQQQVGSNGHAINPEDIKFYAKINHDIVEIRKDFFAKTEQQQKQLDGIGRAVMDLKANQPQIDIDELTSIVLQKIPSLNRQEIVDEVVKRIPKMTGTVTYEVSPVEKLNKDFLEDAKSQIITVINGLDEEQKKVLKFCEAIGKGTTLSEIMEKCLFLNATSGGSRQRVTTGLNTMNGLELIRKEPNGKIYGNLKQKIAKHLEIFSASPQEIEAVYNNILMEMLK